MLFRTKLSFLSFEIFLLLLIKSIILAVVWNISFSDPFEKRVDMPEATKFHLFESP